MWHPDMCRLPGQGLCSDVAAPHFPATLQPLGKEIGTLLEGGLWSAKTFKAPWLLSSPSLVLVLLLAGLTSPWMLRKGWILCKTLFCKSHGLCRCRCAVVIQCCFLLYFTCQGTDLLPTLFLWEMHSLPITPTLH